MRSIFSKEVFDREDLTNLYTITIDPKGSQEFDDAFSISRFGLNGYRFGVHIADVAAQIEIGFDLDLLARKKNMSIYEPDYEPMFPPEIVDKLSLKEAEDRLSRSIFVYIDKNGKFNNVEVLPSIISVNRNLTYKQVTEVTKIDNKLYQTLRNLELALGSLEFHSLDLEESRKEFSKPKKLVERGMVFANILGANYLHNRNIKFLSRSFYNKRSILPPLNFIAKMLVKQGCAFYSVGQHPHEALSLRRYTHWTSPIRRYPDIVLSRQLAAANDERKSLTTNSLQKEQDISNLKLVTAFGLV